MNTVVKYMALFTIISKALVAFWAAFEQDFIEWREKFPPETYEDDPEDQEGNPVTVQPATGLGTVVNIPVDNQESFINNKDVQDNLKTFE